MYTPTQIEAYEFVKYWFPLITISLMIRKGWKSFKESIDAWADKMLNNHLTHIQSATETTVQLLREMKEDRKATAVKVEAVRIDLIKKDEV
jgi:hypothetical protein